MKRQVYEIARDITQDLAAQGKKINYAAEPYLNAMRQCGDITGNYYCDSVKSVVLYFLANARSYRGETAKRLKAELQALCKSC